MKTPTYTATGTKSTTQTALNSDVFDVSVSSHELLKQAYVAYQANGRQNLSKTLRRGEVRGGGKKPWKQKGTGRARFGSIRVPIWRGGGITFGPLGNENYSKNLPTKAKRQAIRQALSLNKDSVIVVDQPDFAKAKTAEAAAFFEKIGAERNALFVVTDKNEQIMRATSNLPHVTVVNAQYLNVFNVLNADTIVVTKDSLSVIDSWLGSTAADQPQKGAAK